MKNGERIIPFSKKDKRLLARHLRMQLALSTLYLLAALLLVAAFLFPSGDALFRGLAGAAAVCFTLMLLLYLFEKRPNLTLRLLRDFKTGKKRVITGLVEQARFLQNDQGAPVQVYDIGPYHFELGQLSPVLKKFRQVMPGQEVEIHQCLHSGIILHIDIIEPKKI